LERNNTWELKRRSHVYQLYNNSYPNIQSMDLENPESIKKIISKVHNACLLLVPRFKVHAFGQVEDYLKHSPAGCTTRSLHGNL
jgi:hypothetical protein